MWVKQGSVQSHTTGNDAQSRMAPTGLYRTATWVVRHSSKVFAKLAHEFDDYPVPAIVGVADVVKSHPDIHAAVLISASITQMRPTAITCKGTVDCTGHMMAATWQP